VKWITQGKVPCLSVTRGFKPVAWKQTEPQRQSQLLAFSA